MREKKSGRSETEVERKREKDRRAVIPATPETSRLFVPSVLSDAT